MDPDKLAYQVKEAIKYYLKSKTAHTIDSPYVFDLIKNILDSTHTSLIGPSIEKRRKSLIRRNDCFERTDFGSGSANKSLNTRKIKVGQWVKKSSLHPYYARILYRLVAHLQPKMILELGTAAGISGAYLAAGMKQGLLASIEGDPFAYQLSQETFDLLELTQVQCLLGTFQSHLLPSTLSTWSPIDLVYIDGHHDGIAVLKYIDQVSPYIDASHTTIIIDDIRWNASMTAAWQTLIKSGQWNVSLDLFRLGILIKNTNRTEFHQPVIAKKFKPLVLGLFR